jgi:hypothetical protein
MMRFLRADFDGLLQAKRRTYRRRVPPDRLAPSPRGNRRRRRGGGSLRELQCAGVSGS